MSKKKTKYVCSNCGYETIRWIGKCPECESWNSFTEEIIETGKHRKEKHSGSYKTFKLSRTIAESEKRIKTGINEFDRVLGGGMMPGSVILIGGDPGIGKSTLVLQAASRINGNVLYVTGEESINQISQRAKRLGINSDSLSVLTETNLENILTAVEKEKPDVVIVDSIQTVYKPELDNTAGTVTQIRESASELMNVAKKQNCSVVLIGHVTKEGIIAGPKILEHIVDTVLQFEGEKSHSYRILRSQKNRFGNTNEIGIFEMLETGLQEVKNPSEIFLNERSTDISGTVVTASIEGSRPLLIEVQALVTPSYYGNPQRVATGFDYRRLAILLAVLEKRAGLKLFSQNVFLNIAGGLRIDEPAIDLAVCVAIVSSFQNRIAKNGLVIIGEVGLGGEIRSVTHIDKRINEAAKLGFGKIILPAGNKKNFSSLNSDLRDKLEINFTDDLNKALQHSFER
ncbi:DNA repair protein RadA [Melioribacter roseus P3M-2]|uniref:DNA repair protein RadA n=1 Tax=Melioribacter roseus (strain DSM 23840 / JCM 17771 / VKM B-2668 / P3M-2) TaxID=1191523 RepID=I7A3G7_MELRP|nr:DNA repair protein RadA [Melioribacter roseus]AFN74421.1 DNA repair protein RadA [Melioribacter roseus P3M-2]